jgi:hypothetical protein
MPDERNRSTGARRRLAGSRSGGEVVRSRFGEALTRRRYCELVGIHPTTLRRWEGAGVVRPSLETILGSPTYVFQQADVAFGKRLAALLRRRPGELSLAQAAAELQSQTARGPRQPLGDVSQA